MRRRTLKSKQTGVTKTSGKVPSTAVEPVQETPSKLAEETKPKSPSPTLSAKAANVSGVSTPATPSVSAKGASTTPINPTSATPVTSAPLKSVPTNSPHPTRPATLYYSSQPRKEKEAAPASAPVPMKTIPSASTTSNASTQPQTAARPTPASSATTSPTSTARPATAATTTAIPISSTRQVPPAASRPAGTPDYRANIERQSREQKSVGNLLSYVVYGMIAFFVMAAALAGYGGYVLSQRISDQSVTVSQLDSKYSAANKDLQAKLATTQEALTQAQAQITRQGDLINKQQDKMNQLITALNDNTKAVTAEKQARTQENNGLRVRVRDLENQKPAATTTR